MAAEEKKQETKTSGSSKSQAQPYKVRSKRPVKGRQRRPYQKRSDERRKDKDPYDSRIISIRRVTNVKKGGKNMSLSVMVAVGDRKGKVGIGTGKGMDVRSAQDKAVRRAKKQLIMVQTKGNTIPHEVTKKYGAARVIMKPASAGTGVIAGSTVRSIVELAGIQDIVTKVLGTPNQVTNARCVIEGLRMLRTSRA